MDFGIADGALAQGVEIADGVERTAADVGRDAGRIRDEEDRVAAGAELDALMTGREKAAAPAGLSAVRIVLAGEEDDERGQVGVFAAESVREPRAETGTADDLMAGVHEDLRRRVIELRGLHRPDDGELVDVLREVRQQVGQFGAGLAVARELERRAEQLGRAFDEREAFAFDDVFGDGLAVVLIQLRLGIEEIELRGRAGHEQVDDALRAGREVRTDGGGGRREEAIVEQRRECERTDAEAALLEEVAARDVAQARPRARARCRGRRQSWCAARLV